MKFGNGQWATQKDSILAYNDENANFKPLPFTASRASTATVVNKAGLLETVASGIPRVDYLSNTSGAYLLEPSSTNLITQSEAFDNFYWTKSGASIEGDASTAGAEQVTNGDFATDSDWTKGADWVISGGVATSSASAASFAKLTTIGSNLVVGKTYLITYTVLNYVSNTVIFTDGVAIGSARNGNGTYSEYHTAQGTEITFRSYGQFNGSIDNVSVKEVSGFASPSSDSPLGAFRLVLDGGGEILKALPSLQVGTDYTFSFYAKTQSGTFDFSFGGISYANTSATATNEWKRFEVTQSAVSTTRYPKILASSSGEMLIFGAQIEAKSYATSYIPTAGSAITRLADTASQTVPDGIINSSEGVLYLEGNNLSESGSGGLISLNNGISNRVTLELDSGTVKARFIVGGVSIGIFNYTISTTNNLKIAITYKLNDFRLWVNGAQRVSSNSGTSFAANTLNKTSFNRGDGGEIFYGKTKDLRVYNTALTDAELVKLTTI